MGSSIETGRTRTDELHTSSLRRPIILRHGELRLSLETEGSVRLLESLSERRLLFGREQLLFFRIKAGVLLQGQRPDWKVKVKPSEAEFAGRPLESVEVFQSVRILPAPAQGYVRALTLRNTGQAPAKVRILSVQDPTAANFRDANYAWGSLGVNAFNRSSHVAMDEVADVPAARVVGSRPEPKHFFMTTDRGRATELLTAGELPEATAGTSGQVIVLAQHDFDVLAGASVRLSMLSVYDPSKLETALASFDRLSADPGRVEEQAFEVAASSTSLAETARWAVAALEGVQFETDQLDSYEVLRSLPLVDPDAAKSIIGRAKSSLARNGSVCHSSDSTRPGVLETSTLLEGASLLGMLTEKKFARALFPALKRLACFLLESSVDGMVRLDVSLPQGWRRRIGRGYPGGEIPEVSLALAGALSKAALVASRLGKARESALWQERKKVVVEAVKKRALDERGSLALCVDGERVRHEDSVDNALACYRLSPDPLVESHIVRRLTEKDFETGWGPRTVPTSNRIYFNPSYGEGQLGGYWTRAALAHAVAAYRAGLGGIGSIELESVSRLPLADSVKLGGGPGDFPYWIDLQRREAHGTRSDPVAAARFLEALIYGELGLDVDANGISFNPGVSSRLKWLLFSGLNLGGRTCVFLGRASGRAYVFSGHPGSPVADGSSFAGGELAEAEDERASAVSFFTPGQAVCVGNGSESSLTTKVTFRPRDTSLSRHLSVGLFRFEPSSGSWPKVSTIRVFSTMSFEAALAPGEWAAFRIATSS